MKYFSTLNHNCNELAPNASFSLSNNRCVIAKLDLFPIKTEHFEVIQQFEVSSTTNLYSLEKVYYYLQNVLIHFQHYKFLFQISLLFQCIWKFFTSMENFFVFFLLALFSEQVFLLCVPNIMALRIENINTQIFKCLLAYYALKNRQNCQKIRPKLKIWAGKYVGASTSTGAACRWARIPGTYGSYLSDNHSRMNLSSN